MPYKDPLKQKEAQRQHYVNNKQRYHNARKKNREKRDIWFRQLKVNCRCQDCGLEDSRCLDFHHKSPEDKAFGISEAVKNAYSEARIVAEIYKCEVLCQNCHIKRHWKPQPTYHRQRVENNLKWLRNYKSDLTCINCQICDPKVLCFHHLKDKHKTISTMVFNGCSVGKLIEEIAKCEVLCANCHRIKHNGNIWEQDSNYGDVV